MAIIKTSRRQVCILWIKKKELDDFGQPRSFFSPEFIRCRWEHNNSSEISDYADTIAYPHYLMPEKYFPVGSWVKLTGLKPSDVWRVIFNPQTLKAERLALMRVQDYLNDDYNTPPERIDGACEVHVFKETPDIKNRLVFYEAFAGN